jgi:hypothetical protein
VYIADSKAEKRAVIWNVEADLRCCKEDFTKMKNPRIQPILDPPPPKKKKVIIQSTQIMYS